MINLKHLKKSYNKNGNSELKVIDDITLELPNKGLIVFLGESGCGKTTLLNIMSGLVDVDSGTIEISNKLVDKNKTWDQIRSQEIGFVFQDNYLIEEQSVYENVKMALEISGVCNKEKIEEAIYKALENVSMRKFENRIVNSLSSGQKQRITIARAIAKNSNILFADEPTGNLDTKNTENIFEILKAISKEKLVVLVTHDKSIRYYADKIYSLIDGKLLEKSFNNCINNKESDDGLIYLDDLKSKKIIKAGELNITLASEDESDFNFKNIYLISKDNKIYINIDSNDRINIVDRENLIVDDKRHKEIISKNDNMSGIESIDLSNYRKEKNYNATFYNSIKMTNRKKYSFFQKALNKSFLLISCMMLIVIAIFTKATYIFSENFQIADSNYLVYKSGINEKVNIDNILNDNNVSFINPIAYRVESDIEIKDFIQNSGNMSLDLHLDSISSLRDNSLIVGQEINAYNEVLISSKSLDQKYNEVEAKKFGLYQYKDILNYKISFKDFNNTHKFKIVGVVESEIEAIYLKPKAIYTLISKSKFYETEKTNISNIINGVAPVKNQIIINKSTKNPDFIDKLNEIVEIDNNEYLVSGYFESEIIQDDYLFSIENAQDIYFNEYFDLNIKDRHKLLIYSNNKTQTIEVLKKQGVQVADFYEEGYESYREQHLKENNILIIWSFVIFIIMILLISFISRGIFLNRKFEIGVLRILGSRKSSILKNNLIEMSMIFIKNFLLGFGICLIIILFLHKLGIANELLIMIPNFVLAGLVISYFTSILTVIIQIHLLQKGEIANTLKQHTL